MLTAHNERHWRRYLACAFTVVLLCLSCVYEAVGETKRGLELSEFWHMQAEKNQPINFAGEVRDYEGNPLVGAEVRVTVQKNVPDGPQYITNTDLVSHTDSDGKFNIGNIIGVTLFIRSIEKDGYEFKGSATAPTSFHFVKRGVFYDPNVFVSYPVSFTMRRLGKSVVLLKQEYQFVLNSEKGSFAVVDLVEDVLRKEERNGDLLFSMEKNDEADAQVIKLRALGEKAGIAEMTEPAYVAPLQGYMSERSIEYRRLDVGKKRYFVLKSRSFPLYSKLEVLVFNHRGNVKVVVRSLTNPFGGVELELRPNAPYEQVRHARQQLRDLVRVGRLPVEQ